MRCPSCGFDNPAGLRFCGNCAAPMVSSQASVERRVVSILFVDVIASTTLSGVLDPEHLRERIAGFFGIARDEIERHGGTIEKYIGDAVMAVFGLPALHENDPERAVQAALAMQTRTRQYVHAGIIPEIRIGVATGEVVADPRAAEKGEFMVTGEVVIVAARLQQHGTPGQILVDEATRAATQHSLEYPQSLALHVKGKADPITAYVCEGRKARPESGRGFPRIASILVGRETEFRAMVERVEQVASGRGGIVSIIGDAGLGKSRLVAEVGKSSARSAVRWLEGRALAHSQSISYWPFLEVLRSAAGITERDSTSSSWGKLEALLRGILPDQLEEVAPYLGSMLGLDVPLQWQERVVYLDGEAMGRQIYRSSHLFFERLAQSRPVVVVFEDLHWLDESSVSLLEHLFPLVRRVPLLLCGLTRPEPSAPAARLQNLVARDYADFYTELRLQPLSPSETAQLTQNLLGAEELPRSFVEALLTRTEGNPFFLEEVLRSLIDLGVIALDGRTGRWEVRTGVEQVGLPGTLRGVIMARVDRLDEPTKDLLRSAAVIGRSFMHRILGAVAGLGDDLDGRLEVLQQLELIRERRRAPELEYTFRHALIQEAIYESILMRRRRELHRRVGEAIETLLAGRLDEFFGVLAFHFARAEEWEKAHDYLYKAGDQAGKMAADAEALAHYEQAAEAYTRVFGGRWDPVHRAALERKVGEALHRRGDSVRASQYCQRALAYLGTPQPASRWGVRGAIGWEILRQIGHRLRPAALGPHHAEPNAAVEERCRIYESLGWVDYFIDSERLFLDALMLLNVSEQHSYVIGITRGSMGMGLICDLVTAFGLAERYHRHAVALAEQVRHPSAIALTRYGLGLHLLHGPGRSEDALSAFRGAAHSYREAGEVRKWGAASQMLIWVLRLHGRISAGLDLSEELIRVGEETGDPAVQAFGYSERGTCLWMAGEMDEGAALLHQARELFMKIPEYANVVHTGSSLGRCHLRQGKLREAVSILEESNALVPAKGIMGFDRSQPLVPLAEAYLVLAEGAGGRIRGEWLRKANSACRSALRQIRADSEIAPGALRVRGTAHWLEGRPEAASAWWRRSVAAAQRLGAQYELGLTCLELGRRTGDPGFLERARALFGEMRARWDLAQAESLLAKAS